MNKIRRLALVMFMVLLIAPGGNQARAQIAIEANATIGVTGVDIEKWAYREPPDWGLILGEASLSVYPLKFGKFSLGADFAYHHFLWYSVQPSGYSYTYDVNVDAFSLGALVRADLGKGLFIEGGFGAYLFGEWTDWGASLAVGVKFPLGERLYVPVKFRSQIVFDVDTNLYPMGLSAGIGFLL